ncbi:PD-(D/E)XK nuclease family protein, partial [Patescibacteria group bacterium]|nr:PD-(D/E)XK nuclease family protein [Patescibacteria group bacterium]
IVLLEADSGFDEISSAALDIKEKTKNGVDINDCAVLVNTNSQARNALEILHGLDVRVSTVEVLNLFDQEETNSFLRILKIISEPTNSSALVLSFFDKVSGITAMEAHSYIIAHNMRDFSLEQALDEISPSLFSESSKVEIWLKQLAKWSEDAKGKDLLTIIKTIESSILSSHKSPDRLVSEKEIINTIFLLAEKEIAKNPQTTLSQFIAFMYRLESYNENIPLVLEPKDGVKVLTLHSSKGREFDYVWIAHMNERSLNSSKKSSLALPESIKDKIDEHDIEKIKRKLYVAITRAKRFCTLSYATFSKSGSDQELAKVIAELPEEVFERRQAKLHNKKEKSLEKPEKKLDELKKSVSKKYADRYVSVSLLNNFYECTWKWYFSNLLQIPMPVIENFEFGIEVHAVIDRILKLKDAPKEEVIISIVKEEVVKSRYGNEATKLRMESEIQLIIKRWVEHRLPEIKLGRKTEEPLSVSDKRFPHLKIFGKIDLIENLGPKEVRVTDFKTGSVRKKSDIEKLDEEGRMSGNLRQLAMYSYLLRENPKWHTDARESRLEFVESRDPKKSFYDRVILSSDIELLVKDIVDYDVLVKTGEWVDRPCNYNSYGKNTECEYCKLSEVYRGPLSSQPK